MEPVNSQIQQPISHSGAECISFQLVTSSLQLYTHSHMPVHCYHSHTNKHTHTHTLKHVHSQKTHMDFCVSSTHASQGCFRANITATHAEDKRTHNKHSLIFVVRGSTACFSVHGKLSHRLVGAVGISLISYTLQLLHSLPMRYN